MTSATLANVDCESVLTLVRQRAGLTFTNGRQQSAEATIRRAMAAAGIIDPVVYCQLLRTDGAALAGLLDDLTVGETYFFREPGHFDLIRRRIIPQLTARPADHPIRVWSAGCASGEEAYSLAIVFEQAGLAASTRVLATDISPAALAKARLATYREWSLRGPGREWALAYLRWTGDRYELDERLRDRVTFEALNLALDVYPALASGTWGVDLLLCRNVLIYFDRETVAAVARRLFASLAPGGSLITASCDPALAEFAPFEVVLADQGIYYRRPIKSPVAAPAGFPASADAPAVGDAGWPAAIQLLASAIDGAQSASDPSCPRPSPLAAAETGPSAESVEAFARRIRDLANNDAPQALQVSAAALEQFPVSAELHYLRAVLLLAAGDPAQAADAARRAIFLDRSLAIVHFTLGTVLQTLGDAAGARRALRNARQLAASRPDDEPVPLGDGERAGRLAAAAAAQLAVIEQAW
jgi:chemotaxis protein methyltransferase CheR